MTEGIRTSTLAAELRLSPTPLPYPPAEAGKPVAGIAVPERKIPTRETHHLFCLLDKAIRLKLAQRMRECSDRIGRTATPTGLARYLLWAIAHRWIILPEAIIGRIIQNREGGGTKLGAKVPSDTFARAITASRDIASRLDMDVNVSKMMTAALTAIAKGKLEIDDQAFLTFLKGGSEG